MPALTVSGEGLGISVKGTCRQLSAPECSGQSYNTEMLRIVED